MKANATFNQEKWHRLDMEKVKRNYIISEDHDEASTGRSSVQIYNGNHEMIFERDKGCSSII